MKNSATTCDYSSEEEQINSLIIKVIIYSTMTLAASFPVLHPPRRERKTLMLHEDNGQSQSGKGHSRVEGSKRRSDIVEVNTKSALQRRWNNGIGLNIVMGEISSIQYCNAATARDTLSISCESVCASATNVNP
jgi:hypothetical protein